MKVSLKTIGLMAVLGLIASVASAQTVVGKAISGSKHDFKTTAYVGADGTSFTAYNKCSTCHAAHKPLKNAALWARQISTTTAQVWTVWNGAAGVQLTAGGDAKHLSEADFAASGSAMCMSCHDGVTAIGGTAKMVPTFRGTWTSNMADIHPIATKVPFNTPGWQADLVTGNGVAISNVVVDVVGGSSYVGCNSCHSMHSSKNSASITRTGERCLSCHNK